MLLSSVITRRGQPGGSVSQHLGQGQLWLVELGASFNLCLSPALLSGAFTRRSNSWSDWKNLSHDWALTSSRSLLFFFFPDMWLDTTSVRWLSFLHSAIRSRPCTPPRLHCPIGQSWPYWSTGLCCGVFVPWEYWSQAVNGASVGGSVLLCTLQWECAFLAVELWFVNMFLSAYLSMNNQSL